MAIPLLTPEQRTAAAAKATAARRRRADIASQLRLGQLSIREVVELAGSDMALAKMRVSAMLESIPGLGKKKVSLLMDRLGIAQSRRLRGLGPYQRQALFEEFEK